MKEKHRSEIQEEDKWNLELVFANDEQWLEQYEIVRKQAKEFSKYKGTILKTSNNLLEVLKEYLSLERSLSTLYVYASMRSDEDTKNTSYQKLKGQADNLYALVSEVTSFVIPELIRGDYSLVLKYIEEEPRLQIYKRMLTDIYRYQKYTLSLEEEKLLSKLTTVFNIPQNTSYLLTNSDLQFGTIKDENNKLVELTNSNYSKYMESFNRDVRKDAFFTLYNGYKSIKNTLAKTIGSEVEINHIIANLRGYNSPLEQALFAGRIDENIYFNLIKVVNDNLPILYKYYDLKREMLKLDELTLYDVHVPIVKQLDKQYDFKEAQKIIKEALSILGTEYLDVLEQAFSDRWIDIKPNDGKKSGAYSWGTYDTNPYILLNYHNRFNDVSTLAHELGHSIHSYYSKKNNEYHDAQYKIFVAEVASLVNELLLYHHLIKVSKNQEEKLYMLNNMLELFKNTLFRQTMFAEFELDIHKKVENNEILTSDLLEQLYYDLNKKYFGDKVVINEEIKYEWARIPHFYMNFYVYQYATGISAACYIVDNILSNKEGAVSNYLEFLKTGNRDYPVELLKIAGVDLSKKEVIESAIKKFENIINEFLKLSRK